MPQYPGFDICTFTAHFHQDASNFVWTNTSYWAAASQNLTETNVVAGCNAFMSGLGNVMSPILHSDSELAYVTALIFKQGGVIEAASTSAAIQGTDDEQEAMPLNAAVVMRKKTATYGRSARGRIYLAGFGEASNDRGQIADDKKDAFAAVGTFYGADRTFVVPFHARHWDRKANIFEGITSCRVVNKISTLRSRTRKQIPSLL